MNDFFNDDDQGFDAPPYYGQIQSIGQEQYAPVHFNFGFPAEIWAGPYREKPEGMFGIKLAPEINADYDISLPIPDYGIPVASDCERAVFAAITLMWAGVNPYVGCMGGMGRTGVFLGVLAKVHLRMQRPWWTLRKLDDPVAYTRAIYRPEAIETDEQALFVRNFNTGWIERQTRAMGD